MSKILIVDDLAENRLMIKLALKNEGYELMEAKNGEEALQKCKIFHPDIILIDALMPVMDGFEAVRRLREMEEFKRVSILMITALDSKKDKIRALDVGVNDFITKPINPMELKARCSSYATLSEINKKYTLATVNHLTKLPNKVALYEKLEKCEKPLMLMIKITNLIFLEKFYGYEIVKNIKVKFVKFLKDYVKEELKAFDIYHTNEGEFVLLQDYKKEFDSTKEQVACEKFLYYLLSNPIEMDGNVYNVSIVMSFGYNLKNIFEHLRVSVTSDSNIKEHVIYVNPLAKDSDKKIQDNIEITKMIKKALEKDKIIQYYQPIYENKLGRCVKYESLVRLIDEDGNVVSPFFFLDISKTNGHYFEITKSVLLKSLNTIKTKSVELNINLSYLDIIDKDITRVIFNDMLSDANVAKKITFEILEDESIDNFDILKDFANRVKKTGAKLAIDDFGSGYSNFERILELKPTFLKIDGTLIKDIDKNRTKREIVSAINILAQNMGIKTVAEFVSSKEIFDIVNEMGIDYSQGYYISEPKPEVEGQ